MDKMIVGVGTPIQNKVEKCYNCEPFETQAISECKSKNCGYKQEKTPQNPIAETCENLKSFLLEKNKRYGNSALKPLKVFSKIEPENSICVRMDDKLSRIVNGSELKKNDIVDLTGYLILLCTQKNWTDFKELID